MPTKRTDTHPETVDSTPVPDVPGEEPATAEQLAADASFADRSAQDYGQLVAVGPCMYQGQLAFREGDAVPASHPTVPVWIRDGCVARLDEQGEKKS